jgi:hypothetical protein
MAQPKLRSLVRSQLTFCVRDGTSRKLWRISFTSDRICSVFVTARAGNLF